MKRLRTIGIGVMLATACFAMPVQAASPYDDYYNDYDSQADPEQQAAPMDNDSYYTAPGGNQYTTDNDAYYTAPGAYSNNYPTAPGKANCNTIGDMPSCNSD